MATEWAQKVLVRLDANDAGILREVQRDHPGKDAASTFREIMRAALVPRDLLIRWRWPEGHANHVIVPDWRPWGPFSPAEIGWRIEALQRKGCEIEMAQVPPKVPRPAWPGDDVADADDDTEEEEE